MQKLSDKLSHKLGLGTWQFGGANFVNGKPTGWGDFDENEAIDTIVEALESGIRFFDTADSYGRGLSEKVLGKALKQNSKNEVVICTKFGNRETEKDIFIQDFSSHWLEKCVEQSLNRLQVNSIEVLLFHSPPDSFDWLNYDTSSLDNLISKGYIKKYGVSSKSVYGAKKVVDSNFGSVVEIIYNMFDRRAENLLFTSENQGKYDFIARVPFASGFLTSKNIKQTPIFRQDDYRSNLAERDKNWLLEQVQKLSFLEELDGGLTINALKFCMQNESIAIAIPGARNKQQLQQNLQSLQIAELRQEHIKKIKELVPDVPDWWKPINL